jgi:hypothetical protein
MMFPCASCQIRDVERKDRLVYFPSVAKAKRKQPFFRASIGFAVYDRIRLPPTRKDDRETVFTISINNRSCLLRVSFHGSHLISMGLTPIYVNYNESVMEHECIA